MSLNTLLSTTPPQQGFPKAYENDRTNEGKVEASLFDELEIEDIYSNIGNRKYERNLLLGNTISTYTDWTHVQAENSYGIWKYPVSTFVDNTNNQLFKNYIELSYQGEADSELSATSFTSVFISDSKKSGETFTDVTSEAGSLSGTPFNLVSTVDNIETISGINYTSAVSLAYNNILEGTLTVTTTASASPFVTYTEDSDYTVDYDLGEVTVLSGGTIASGSTLLFDYSTGNSIFIGLSASTFSSITVGLAQKGVGNVYNYTFSSASGFNSFTPTTDATNNFSTDGNITLGTLSGWATTTINSATNYYIRMRLTTQGVVIPTCNNILKSDSAVTKLLKLTYQDILNNDYKWCFYNDYVYATIPNSGASNDEGIKYITNGSSATAKQNYFVYNNEYLTNYRNTVSATDMIFGDVTISGTLDVGGAVTLNSTLTDGTATLNSGAWSEITTLATTGNITCGDDLLMSNLGIINFNSGDVTLTHSANELNLAGGSLKITASSQPSCYITGTDGQVAFGVDNTGTSGRHYALFSTDDNFAASWPNSAAGAFGIFDFDANATRFYIDSSGNATFLKRLLVDDATQATTTTDGSLQTDGGLSVEKNAVVGGDIYKVALTSWTQTFTTAGTAPTFSTNNVYYKQVGKLTEVWGTLQNSSGGTAGSGAVVLDFDVPVAINSNFNTATLTCANLSILNNVTFSHYYGRAVGGKIRFYDVTDGTSLMADDFNHVNTRQAYYHISYEAA